MVLELTVIGGVLVLLAMATTRISIIRRKKKHSSTIDEKSERLVPSPFSVGEAATKVRNNPEIDVEDLEAELEIDLGKYARIESEAMNRKGVTLAGFEAAGLYGADILHNFLAVDDHVYEGIGRLANEQFASIGDLSAKVQSYEHNIWDGLSEKGVDKVGGHIGEAYAAEHFADTGVNVEWPDASNQVGWDLLLNGHETNVKLLSDATNLSEHFSKYPDIPAIIPGDAANIPEGAFFFDPSEGIDSLTDVLASGQENLVIVDTSLSGAEIMEQTANATDLLAGSADIVGANIPLVTLAFSGWRETKLLRQSQTNLSSAAKNIGLDVAGTGLGAAAGAKGGALIGTMIGGPVGAGIGALVGGIAGAVGGRYISNDIKKADFEEALEEVKNAEESFSSALAQETEHLSREYEVAKLEKIEELRRQAQAQDAELQAQIADVREKRVNDEKLSKDEIKALFDKAMQELDATIENLKSMKRDTPFLKRTLWPDVTDMSINAGLDKLHSTRKNFVITKREHATTRIDTTAEVFSTLANLGLQRKHIIRELKRLEKSRLHREKDLRASLNSRQEDLIKKRVEATKFLRDKIDSLKDRMRETLKPRIDDLNSKSEHAKQEAAKLGRA